MSIFKNLAEKKQEKIQNSLSLAVKIVLLISSFYAVYFHLWQILFANLILLLLLFTPLLLRKKYQVKIPIEFELLFLLFTIITFFLGNIRGVIIQTFFGVAIGFIGFAVMLMLFSNSKIKTSYSLIVLFSFSLSVTFGVAAELIKYYLKTYFDYGNVLADYPYTMTNLTLVSLGALFSSVLGYAYMKGYRPKVISTMVSKFKKTNPNFFSINAESPEAVHEIIKKGESDKIEFKSTLRTNLHTSLHDKNIEVATLKTLVAMMNAEGGALLLGVDDNGEITGIEKDNFESPDKFNLHLSNLIKEKIGKEYLPYLNFQLMQLDSKNIVKIECKKSSKPVFLKHEGKEHFFTRANAASIEVAGSKLLDYINNKFEN